MALSLTTNTRKSSKASQTNPLNKLTLPRATTDSFPTSTNLSSELNLSFGAETQEIAKVYRLRTAKAHRSLTEEFQELSFSARNVVRATAA